MYILTIVIFISITGWVLIDYKKINDEKRCCPKCNQTVKQKFSWKYNDKPISIPGKNGETLNVTIYKCHNCGFSWNHTYECGESTT